MISGTLVELPGPAGGVAGALADRGGGGSEPAGGATDWCTHPAGLAVTRVWGTKNPERARIAALAPDLVIANRERTASWMLPGCGRRAWPCG